MKKARNILVKIFKILSKPEMRILPGHLAFFLVITIIPLVALIGTIASSLSISMDAVKHAVSVSVPKEIAILINSIGKGEGINFNIIVFYISAFFLASNGAFSMINTSNEIYKVKPKNIISRRLKAIIMTMILVCLFLFLVMVPIFGTTIFNILAELTNNNTILKIIEEMLKILKYPLILLIIFTNIKLMYMISPDSQIPSNTTNKGAIFATIGWVLSTEIFAFYIDTFAKYNIFYGSISNILVLLLWVYLLSYIYVLGMIINASNYENTHQEEILKSTA